MSCQQKINIEKWNSRIDGELSSENMEKKLRFQGYSFVKYCFQPGTDFPDHTHEVSKKDAIISGIFLFSMYGQTVVLEPGDIVKVPKHTIHNARVVGSENVIFYDSTK
ncbi:Hypothetical predicted protein [Mytilus galloprovincialis]|uniref:Cupin type-2 domain-containing protein n=1 Tax=Mytilus galloprovincialis TaxID=29158 RepID=A0A8B6DUP5_MYTGA|nr:Hypothetical predicted protein [Mytilus galloprovincialis]VDI25471.1 Hypothetical predicted protein [Mytilus galloprovincialis]